MTFVLGQRWVSDTESDLGLGTVVAIDDRRITILFPASGETRLYANTGAPITRVLFNVGDTVKSADDWKLLIKQIDNNDGLMLYSGIRVDTQEEVMLVETRLDHFITFNNPQDKLFAGQIDRFDRFNLRYQCWKYINQQQTSKLLGLTGARASLIPHQLYIAQEVGQRYAPRVLLADEVGLGKTIEAGLIIHQQLQTGRATRVLIVVPESLQHQWLVEMLRRFNLHFAIFDAERCEEVIHQAANPFDTEQLVLTSLHFLTSHKRWFDQLAATDWDLLVVDEAHHLAWDQQAPSTAYQRIETLATQIKGLILLTATPDQLGQDSHFARLKLLDPNRFHDPQQFIEEQAQYTQVAAAANDLLAHDQISTESQQTLQTLLSTSDIDSLLLGINHPQDPQQRQACKQQLLQQLLDRHGTGRILFRNTRQGITGFPARSVQAVPLDMPKQYLTALNVAAKFAGDLTPEQRAQKALFPEKVYSDFEGQGHSWSNFDPRIDWLISQLKEHKRDKFILICAHAETAIALEQILWSKEAIRAAVFHEGLTVFERDKAAAYFAEQDDSAQLLLCSEIGSEGRNFQFAHHLILFDLPLNPDLLEQRIGRLDRIGQTETINIHIPYFVNTAQSVLFDWYHQGLNAFNQTCATGRNMFEQYSTQLFTLMGNTSIAPQQLKELLAATQDSNQALKQKLEQGRDQLLELHSSGKHSQSDLVEQISTVENGTELPIFMIKIFDTFGIGQEDTGDQSIILRPTEHMLSPSFPYLTDEGCTVTFHRQTALAQEHIHFISWEHPMVQGALDLVTTDDIGSCSVAVFKNKALPAGSHFVELIYVAQPMAPNELQIGRYLPTTPIRVLLDKNNNSLGEKISFEHFTKQLSPVGKKIGSQVTLALQGQISAQIPKGQAIAAQALAKLKTQAIDTMRNNLDQELTRLSALQQINPNIRPEELTFIQKQQQQLAEHINKTEIKLDAIRIIIVSHG